MTERPAPSAQEIFEGMLEGVVLLSGADSDLPIVEITNQTARTTLESAGAGHISRSDSGVPLAAILPDRGDRDLVGEARRTLLTGLARRGVQVWRTPDGSARVTLDYVMTPLSDGTVLWSFRDVSEAVRTAVSSVTSIHDSLTGLPNRELLRQRMLRNG